MKKSVIPNLFTFLNLSCGILSLLSTANEKYLIAAIFILFGALIDRYDGRIARLLNVSSELGKELDSLADLVSFGVAPSLLCYFVYNTKLSAPIIILWVSVLLLFSICGAYRLARYNATDFDGTFTGIPITVAGSVLAVLVIINFQLRLPSILVILLIISLAYLMISSIKFKKI